MNDKVNYISPKTFQIILDSISRLKIRKWKNEDIQMLFKILYWCALRPSEGINVKKEDFDLDDREVLLGRTKTNKYDNAPIPQIFINELAFYLDQKDDGRLFPELTYNTAYHWFVRLGVMLNIKAWIVLESESGEKTKGHIFRKTVGKDMLSGIYGEKASAIPIISKQLRHKKPSTTIDHYLNASIESVKEAW